MKLPSHTIVPANLYVRRRADDQLSQIIADMGRPGYVLVARQMGKTNLLLNARRTAEPNDHFVYLDVSNVFPDERSFFRNIVDIAVDALQEKGVFLYETLNSERSLSELLPHKEHERELRRLLQAVPGKVIICLDEIDALTKTNYSDQIFSFIRSIYFSGRANIPEFSRLTYVLSGVAEPAELIKNRAISPFNIGEKIYLDDFTAEEVKTFLDLAEIDLSQEVFDAIYGWTSGHPRMTWDLIAELLKNETVGSVDDTDAVVRRLYFSSVDVPPVDHIKTLVEASRDVRDALISMHYGKSESISDAVRTKLYLDGISKFNPNTQKISFKNRVLELSLSEQFLVNLDRSQPTYDSALRSLHSKSYGDALSGFSTFIKAHPDDSRVHQAQYWAGVSAYFQGQYHLSIEYFSTPNAKLPVSSIVARYFFHGMALYRIGDTQAAISPLVEAVKGKFLSDFPEYYFEAKVFLSTALLSLGTRAPNSLSDAIALSESMLDEEELAGTSIKDPLSINRLMYQTHLNLANAAILLGEKAQALASLSSAREYSDAAGLLHLLLVEHSTATHKAQNIVTLDAAREVVLSIRVFDSEISNSENDLLNDVISLSEKLLKAGRANETIHTIEHVLSHLSGKNDIFTFVNALMLKVMSSGQNQVARRLVDVALKVQAARGGSEGQRNLLALAIIIQEAEADKYATQFFSTFEQGSGLVSPDELRFIAAATAAAVDHGNAAIAERGCSLIEMTSLDTHGPITLESVELLKSYFRILHSLRFKPENATMSAAQGAALLRRLSNTRSFDLAYFPAHYHRTMQAEIHRRLRGMAASKPIKRERKIGRNDIVSVDYDGVKKTGKYKTFLTDLNNGICKLLAEPKID